MGKIKEKPWDFHTCKFCPYRSQSTFVMYKHGRLHRTKSDRDFFSCHLKDPEMLECQLCGFDASVKVDINRHASVTHEGKEVNGEMENTLKCYKCRNCDFETYSVLVLTKHVDDCSIAQEKDKPCEGKEVNPEQENILTKHVDDCVVISSENLEETDDEEYNEELEKLVDCSSTSSDILEQADDEEEEAERVDDCNPALEDNLQQKGIFRGENNNEKPEKNLNCHRCKNCNFETHSALTLMEHVDDCNLTLGDNLLQKDISQEKDKEFKNTLRRYRCKYCDFQTHLVPELKKHVANCNAAFSDNLEVIDMTQEEDKELKTDCKAPVSNNLGLKEKPHEEKEVHGELENISKYYQCDNCNFKTHSSSVLTKHLDDCDDAPIDNLEQTEMFHEENNGDLGNILEYYRCKDCNFETLSVLEFMQHDCDETLSQRKDMFSIIEMKNTNDLLVVTTETIKILKEIIQPFDVICSNDDEDLLKEVVDKKVNVVLTRIDLPESERSGTVGDSPKTKYKTYPSKRNCCFYCKELLLKLPIHLANKHSKEEEVKKFIHLPKGCCERKKIIERLRRLGNFEYNKSKECKEIITCRRLKRKKNVDFVPCGNCKGYFSKNALRVHFRRCANKKDRSKTVMILSKQLKCDFLEGACKRLKTDILPVLRSDKIAEIIVHDSFMILFGNHLCCKYKTSISFAYLIRSILRTLGRFFIEIKTKNSQIKLFEDIFDPIYFKDIGDAVHSLGRKDPKSGSYGAPTTILNLGLWFRQSIQFYIILCIRDDKFEERSKAERLLGLMRELMVTFKQTVNEQDKKILSSA